MEARAVAPRLAGSSSPPATPARRARTGSLNVDATAIAGSREAREGRGACSSRWSARRRRSPRASWTPSAPRGSRSSARRRPRRSSSRRRTSPSASWCATAFRRRATRTFTDAPAAHAYVDANGAPIVVKADGLAAGKGVVVAMTLAEAHAAVDMMLAGGGMGEAGHRVVIEEFMAGEEASFIVMADGKQRARLRLHPGPQADLRRRPRPQHRRHGRLLARAGRDARGARPRHARGHPADAQGHGEGRHALHRASSTRAS